MLLIFSYLLGAVPFGLLWGRVFADVDIREFGSGNIGATNMNRVLGRKLGAATLASDILKAIVPVGMAQLFLQNDFQVACVGVAAVLGHCYPIYLKFMGGKGVASSFGIMLWIAPFSALVALALWLLTYRFTKISSLSAIIATSCLPLVVFFEKSSDVALVVLVLCLLVVFRHRENIERLRQGKEK